MTPVRRFALVVMAGAALLGVTARRADADATAFLGVNMTPANRPAKGVALGVGFLIVGFEVEYSDTGDDPSALAPSLQTGTGNVLLQTPLPILGFQPYVTTGVGVYHEALGTQSDIGLATNAGGGVKITLIGPLKLRLDYRVFRLGSGALNSPAQRVYAGVNLAF